MPLEFHLTMLHCGLNVVARFEFALQQLHRQRIKQQPLDGAFERAGTELRI
jgi:hypothetical protein